MSESVPFPYIYTFVAERGSLSGSGLRELNGHQAAWRRHESLAAGELPSLMVAAPKVMPLRQTAVGKAPI